MESIQWILTVSLLRDKLINRHSTNNKFDSLALKSFISDIFEKKILLPKSMFLLFLPKATIV